jgi:hypothetical protein
VSDIEDLLGRTLRDPARALPAPADPLPAIRARAGRQRRNTALGVVAAVLVVAATLAVPAAVTRLNRAAPTATTDSGLLPWAPRGELAGDTDLAEAAEKAWRSGSGLRPTGRTRTLWAGRIGLTRVVLLQARTAAGPAVAELWDRDGRIDVVAADPLGTSTLLRVVAPFPNEYEARLLGPPDTSSIEVYVGPAPLGALRGDRGEDGLVVVEKVDDAGGSLVVALDVGGRPLTSGLLPAIGSLPLPRGAVTVVGSEWDPSVPAAQLTGATVDDGAALAERLGGPIEIAQLAGPNSGFQLRGETYAFPRFYEVHRDGTRYLATLVAVQDEQGRETPYCIRLERITGAGPAAIVNRCALPAFDTGALSVLSRSDVRSGELVVGSQRHPVPGYGTSSLENTGPNFPAAAGRLELVDKDGRRLPTIQVPAYRP